jgi:hypothetical protein
MTFNGRLAMTDSDYKQLYVLLRQFQMSDCPVGGKTYNAADTVLTALFPHYYNQNREQER